MPRSNIILRRQARKMVYDVYCFMKKEVKTEKDTVKRTAEATKTSERTVRRIVKESRNSEHLTVFRTPGKKRTTKKPITDIDTFDQFVIRTCVHNYHITNKELPTVEKLQKKLKEDINFNGSERSLRRILYKLGFRWKKSENKRKLLIEKSNIRLLRIEYLEKITKYRGEGRPIIYTDESYVDSSHSGLQHPWHGVRDIVYRALVANHHAAFVYNYIARDKSGVMIGYKSAINYIADAMPRVLEEIPSRNKLI